MVSKAFSVVPVCPGMSEAVGIYPHPSVSNRLFPLKRRSPIVQPILGATSQLIDSSKWYKDVAGLGVDAIEINRRHSKLHFNVYFLDKVKRYLQGTNVSVHSATTGIFQGLESFTQAELATLQAEVDVARFLGAHEVVFHLNGGALIHDDHKERLAQIINYGRERGVDLIYESDTVLQANHTCEVLETFSDVGYALDLGHLNNGYRRNLLGCDIDEFISRVRERVVYIHANNNCGTVDEHKGLKDGSLDWRGVLGMLDMRRIKKIIIEVCSIEYLKDTRDELKGYLANSVHNMVQLRK
jgi:sugar phosphate isomerase/epimerase